MTNQPVNRSLTLTVVPLAALLCSAAAIGAPAQRALDVFGTRVAASAADVPATAKPHSASVGTLNAGALSAPVLDLVLPDASTITARLQRVIRDDNKGTQSWVGTFDDAPGSVLVLTRARGVTTGFANYKDQTLEIQPAAGGKHMLYAVDSARLPKTDRVEMPVQTMGDVAAGLADDYGTGGSTQDAAGSIVQDVLVAYTAASASRYGQAGLESMIRSAVQAANQAYLNSKVGITMNLVGTQQVAIVERGSMIDTVGALRTDAAVGRLRDQLGADVVMLVSENSDYCGLASLMMSNSTSFAPNAYGVVYSSCLSNQSLAHEVGHVQGLMHDRANSGGPGAYPYSYGYRVCASDGTGFRDIMSYSCSGAPRVLLFSDPNTTYNGHAAGVSYEMDPTRSAENARTLMNTAATVAAFRNVASTVSLATTPSAPTGLTSKASAYNSVSLAWTDGSTNESGFKLERSADGVGFTEIATLGAGTQAFTDAAVTASSRYYYRVRAYNSYGVSGYSGTLVVTTPDAPPPPPTAPTSVTAVGGSDGSAIVAWSVNNASATNFEVRREKWDSRKNVWGSGATAATVPGTVLSIVDSTGAGTYRYFVRASNSGGASAFAGPADVVVTTATTTSAKKTPPGRSR